VIVIHIFRSIWNAYVRSYDSLHAGPAVAPDEAGSGEIRPGDFRQPAADVLHLWTFSPARMLRSRSSDSAAGIEARPERCAHESRDTRAGNLLLCKKPLKIKGDLVYGNGCNSWKGRFYDQAISQLISTTAFQAKNCTNVHIIAALSLAYLAMVTEFGYVVALMRSGLLVREQFFRPTRFHPALPLRSQMLLGGGLVTSPDAPMWAKPFSFGFERPGFCTVAARNFGVLVPISRDPREPIATRLRIAPARYKLRPDFRTVFD
jgi:hypothetical protein